MTRRSPHRSLLLAVPVLLAAPLLLAGCGSAGGATGAADPTPGLSAAAATPGTSMPGSSMPGMSMPGTSMPGMSTPAGPAPSGSAAGGSPTETAVMVCGGRVADAIAQALALPAPPRTDSSWTAPVFTCTYHLPVGPLVLSVQVAADPAAAGAVFDADRSEQAGTSTLPGLGERAFGTPAGVTTVVKDAQVLTVDASALPAVFGSQEQHRTDFADEVAAAVMGCWTAHG